jgi:2-polyprenyl-6-methoxyphenol hydroxylase-like FAD-dependent oxidoreductase
LSIFRIEQPHGIIIARQWFPYDGVLAYLHRCPTTKVSIVWSVGKTRADRLRALDDQAFTRAVMRAGDHVFPGMARGIAKERDSFATGDSD